jgi:hypothetical protein
MEPDLFKQMSVMPDEKLFEFVTERDSSQRRHVAEHILEMRRTLPLHRAAEASAKAAIWSAIAAFISAVVAIVALFHHHV